MKRGTKGEKGATTQKFDIFTAAAEGETAEGSRREGKKCFLPSITVAGGGGALAQATNGWLMDSQPSSARPPPRSQLREGEREGSGEKLFFLLLLPPAEPKIRRETSAKTFFLCVFVCLACWAPHD